MLSHCFYFTSSHWDGRVALTNTEVCAIRVERLNRLLLNKLENAQPSLRKEFQVQNFVQVQIFTL